MVTVNISNSQNTTSNNDAIGLMKKLKFLEEQREKSFKYWQYGEDENCSVKKMAEAGFYYSGSSDDDDSATCFVCGKVLDGWEKNDDPWNEHEKHAPNCSFVKIHLSQDDFTTKHFLELASIVIKNCLNHQHTRKMQHLQNRIDEITNSIKNQQF